MHLCTIVDFKELFLALLGVDNEAYSGVSRQYMTGIHIGFIETRGWMASYTSVFLLFLVTLAASGQNHRSLDRRDAAPPNILWLTFEDTSPEFIGCYGNKVAKTPVMDKLAAEGTRFTAAYSTGSVCSPSLSFR